ncbi:MAG: LamG-like jellyroll fold domain-containing protein [Crocinitomicaceae bacterium]
MKKILNNLSLIVGLFVFITPAHLSAQSGMKFDDINDYVSVPNASALIAGSSTMSLSFWVYPENTSAGFPNFDGFAGFRNNSNADFYLLQLSSTNVEARFRNSVGSNFDIVFTSLNLNQWNHFVFTYDGSAINLYHDGVNVGSTAANGTITSTTQALDLGRTFFSNPSFYLDGKLDNVALWGASLNPNQVANLYTNTCAHDLTDPSLLLCYEFTEGVINGNNTSIPSLFDGKGNINGTFNGLALNGTTSNYALGVTPSVTTSTIDTSTCTVYMSPAGNMYSAPGVYHDTLVNVYNCDSLITINLTNLEYQTTISESVCASYTTPSGGATYTTNGVYLDTLTSTNGCDSILTINLTIATYEVNITENACGSYTVPSGNATYSMSGVYNDTLQTVLGCDSVLVIDLTIGDSESTITETACDSYTAPSGNATYTANGVYTDTLTNAVGCDSVITINLIINSVDTGVSLSGETLTSSDPSGSYQWINCSTNTPIVGATSQSYTPLVSGNYAVIISSANCTDTSTCTQVTISSNSLEEQALSSITTVPNPVIDDLTIDFNNYLEYFTVKITNLAGQEIITKTFKNTNSAIISMTDFEEGVYVIMINSGNSSRSIRVVKL